MKPTDLKLYDFFKQFKPIHFKENEIIIESQQIPPGIIYIEDGFVRQYAISEEGHELTLHIYETGASFPMTWGLNDIPNRYYFQAVTPVSGFIAPKNQVSELFQNESDVSFAFSKRLLAGLDGFSRRLESIVFGDARERVISILIYLAHHFGETENQQTVIHYKFTHDQIATMVGISREHTSLELERLIKENLIVYDKHTLIIPSLKKMEDTLPTSV